MSKSSHAVKIQKGSTTYTCDLYTTTAEARSNLNPTYPLFRVNVGGTTLYAPFTPTLNSSTESTPFICPIFAGSGDNTEYCLAQHSFFSIGITTKSNETITVNAGGQSWTSGTKWFPYGTTWTASVSGSTGWNAGTLTPASSGTLTNASVTVTASAATHKTYKITLTQKANETVTIHYKNHNGTSLASSWSTTTSSITLGHSSQYYLTISASTGYTAGTITNAGSSSSPRTLTAAVTISFTAATAQKFYLRYDTNSFEVRYNNANGSKINSGTQINYNQAVYVKYAGSGAVLNYKFTLYKNSTGSGTVWTTKTSAPFTFNMPNSQIYIKNNSEYDTGGGN